MKITIEVLKSLGFELIDDCWVSAHLGYRFRLRQVSYGSSIYRGWEFYSSHNPIFAHSVTNVEEFFGFIAKDHYEAGREQMRFEFRELLGIKENY